MFLQFNSLYLKLFFHSRLLFAFLHTRPLLKHILLQRLALWVKFSADDILKYFSYFSQETDFDISCKFSADDILKYFSYFSQETDFDISCKLSPMETICMKCHILFSGKNKNNITNLLSAEYAQRVGKVKSKELFFWMKNCLRICQNW